jgi:hypothetical protein
MGSVQGDLILAGQPAIDPDAHGVVAAFAPRSSSDHSPATASAGQGTPATYVVQVTNTGSADDTFALSVADLPAGVTAQFSPSSVEVPPGISNFRDVTLTLTPQAGTTAGSDAFRVTATSTSKPSVAGTAAGMLNVLDNGVSVSLTPSSGAPGSSFELKVTNAGKAKDSFNLALGGPAALVSQLGSKQVTLAAGDSQMVPISTGAVNFAVQGPLNLAATATSETNPNVQDGAMADLTIPATTGMTASFSPATQSVSVPGTVSFVLQVHNTGNSEDSYTATISGTNGPITATFMGVDGKPTQTIPIFRVPGLGTASILVQANLKGASTGNVTVQVQSLSDASIMASPTATVTPIFVPVTTPPATTSSSASSASPASASNFMILGLEINGLAAVGFVTLPGLQVLDVLFGYFPALANAGWGLIATPVGNGLFNDVLFNDPGELFFTLLQVMQAESALEFNWLGLSPSFDVQVTVPPAQGDLMTAEVFNGQGVQTVSTPFFPL